MPTTTYANGSTPTRMQMRARWIVCAVLACLLTLWLLTGCETASPAGPGSLSQSLLYQPPVLRLPAQQPVQTLDGVYRPQTQEVWHSDARFRQLEQQLVDATTALTELQNRKP